MGDELFDITRKNGVTVYTDIEVWMDGMRELRPILSWWSNKDYLAKSIETTRKDNLGAFSDQIAQLEQFFQGPSKDVDICIIMNSALQYGVLLYAQELLPFHPRMNIWYYRPEVSHLRGPQSKYLVGNPNPQNTLLLFDADMLVGQAVFEVTELTRQMSFPMQDTYLFLANGAKHINDRGGPILDSAEAILAGLRAE
jgi:hypothetical protein